MIKARNQVLWAKRTWRFTLYNMLSVDGIIYSKHAWLLEIEIGLTEFLLNTKIERSQE